jgi:hypothetical protein
MPDIKQQIHELKAAALGELAAIRQAGDLEGWRVRYLAKRAS